MKIYALLFLLILVGCNGSQLERQFSPSGLWILEVEQDHDAEGSDHGELLLTLVDRDGVIKDTQPTGVSHMTQWAVTWYNDWTIVMASEEEGTRVWTINDSGKFDVLDIVSEEMIDVGKKSLTDKYAVK